MKFSLFLHVEHYDDQTPIAQQIAERGGFEAAWVGEYHGMGSPSRPTPS